MPKDLLRKAGWIKGELSKDEPIEGYLVLLQRDRLVFVQGSELLAGQPVGELKAKLDDSRKSAKKTRLDKTEVKEDALHLSPSRI